MEENKADRYNAYIPAAGAEDALKIKLKQCWT
jgi:hypothetical protein